MIQSLQKFSSLTTTERKTIVKYPDNFPTSDAEKNAQARRTSRFVLPMLIVLNIALSLIVAHFNVINPLATCGVLLLNMAIIPLYYIYFLYCHFDKIFHITLLTFVGATGYITVSLYGGVLKILSTEEAKIAFMKFTPYFNYFFLFFAVGMLLYVIIDKFTRVRGG